MKQITLKYNPYTVTTQFTVDGNKPKNDSKLNVGKSRLQEWADKLPEWLLKEFNDKQFSIKFTGTDADFEDLKSGFEKNKVGVNAKFTINPKPSVDKAETAIEQIFQDIQKGPIQELKSKAITTAFQKAKDSKFEVNVVATMSSGKSTLINSLLGKQIMPSANEATTATIVKVIDNDGDTGDDFYAVGYDAEGKKVFDRRKVELKDIQIYNADDKVSFIDVEGSIPCVDATGMRLVLVDTPGPNNARNKQHEEMTYKMMADSDKSLVLVVLNAQQSGITDENLFLDYICNCMKNGGKQSKDRFIFVLNKINCFDPRPQQDGPGCISRVLNKIKKDLEDRGIQNPNIFPVAALPALEKRTADPFGMSLMTYKMMLREFEEMQFDKYYEFSHLPNSSCQFIEDCKSKAKDDDLVEIQTGIFNLEEAIALYINKYARNTKVMDLVLAFNSTLEELSAVANLEETIRKDKDAKKKLETQIAAIRKNIKDARDAKTYSKKIDAFNVSPKIKEDIKQMVTGVNTQINSMKAGKGTKVEAERAKAEVRTLERSVETLKTQIKARVEETITKNFTKSLTEMLNFYQMYLEELELKVDKSGLSLSPFKIATSQMKNLDSIVKNASKMETKTEVQTKYGRYLTKEENKNENAGIGAVIGGIIGTIINPGGGTFVGATIGGAVSRFLTRKDYLEERKEQVTINTTYVNMQTVANEYLTPIQEDLRKMYDDIVKYVEQETAQMKDALKKSLAEIDNQLDKKLEALSKVEADDKAMASDIAAKQKKLAWLNDIEKRVNDIVNF